MSILDTLEESRFSQENVLNIKNILISSVVHCNSLRLVFYNVCCKPNRKSWPTIEASSNHTLSPQLTVMTLGLTIHTIKLT